MRLLQVDCEVFYKGRGQSYLERGDRLIIIKNDMSVTVHQDSKMQPLNYMKEYSEINNFTDANGRDIMIVKSKTEEIKIIIYETKFDKELTLTENSSLERKGTEQHLQCWLSDPNHFKSIFGNYATFIRCEFDTGNGSCDIIGLNNETNKIMLIEVKRNASKKDIYQVVRYRDALKTMYSKSVDNNSSVLESRQKEHTFSVEQAKPPVELFLVASEVKKGVVEEGNKHNVNAIELGYDWIEERD